jgi:ribonucleoside-diphosphate reductase alpha chain
LTNFDESNELNESNNNNIFPEIRKISDVAMNILRKRYFLEGEKTWENVAKRVVNFICYNSSIDYDDKKLIEQMILNRYFIPNSPCLVNANKKNGGLLACFVVDFKDTIEDIYKTKLDFALIAKKGGGAGTTLSNIRPKGSPVQGSSHGFSGGPIDFFNTICHDMEVMTQAGFRQMAMMGTMSIYHPDIIDFINVKEQEGKMATTNLSVVVDDAFMQKVLNNETYWTEFNGVKYQEYKAKDIFSLIVEGCWRNGEPGLIFNNRINDSPYKYAGVKIQATNPCGEQPLPPYVSCLSKDTLMMTEKGIRKIEDIKDGLIVSSFGKNNRNVINKIIAFKTGKKPLVKINFHNGMNLKCTKDHQIFTDKGFIEAQNLIKEKARIKWMIENPLMHPIDKNDNTLDYYFSLGWMHGDGWMTENTIGISFNNQDGDFEIKDKILNEYHKHFGNRSPLKNDNTSYQEQTETKKYLSKLMDLGIKLGKTENREIPLSFYNWNLDQQLAFLSSLFTADGFVQGKTNNQIYLASRSKILMQQVQTILSSIGIQSAIYESKFISSTRKNQYKLSITKQSALKFMDYIGFLTSQKNNKFNYNGLKKYIDDDFLEVNSIEEIGEDTIYDFSSEIIHNGYANGILVHNCNLGSLDLSKFVNKEKNIDFEKLELSIRLGIRFLDTVIDKNIYPTKEIEKTTKKCRPVGLCTMGWADYFLMKGIAYGSKESLDEVEKILSFMKHIAENESENLGKKFDIPEWCSYLPIPRRNITLLSVAPTGTVSIIAGCNSSIEPIFSEIVIRNDKTGTYQFENDLASQPYFRCAVSSNGPDKEVTWEEHVKIQAMAQKYIDSGTSKTINFPNHTHRETIANAFILAWQLGCKGITGYRNGSRKQEVLSPKKLKRDKCPACGEEIIIYNGYKKCTKCDWTLYSSD